MHGKASLLSHTAIFSDQRSRNSGSGCWTGLLSRLLRSRHVKPRAHSSPAACMYRFSPFFQLAAVHTHITEALTGGEAVRQLVLAEAWLSSALRLAACLATPTASISMPPPPMATIRLRPLPPLPCRLVRLLGAVPSWRSIQRHWLHAEPSVVTGSCWSLLLASAVAITGAWPPAC